MRGPAKRKWRRLKAALLGLAVAGITFLAVSWLLFQHVPSWYQPIEVPPDQVQRVQADLMRTTDTLNERMVRAREPFQFTIGQDQVNAWLAAREDMWPLSREWLPPGVSDPFVTIDAEAVRLAGTVQYGSVQTVVSVRLTLTADAERVRVQLLDVTGGSLPVPRGWVEELLVRFQQTHAGRLERLAPDSSDLNQRNHIMLNDLYEGIDFSNRGLWRQLDNRPRPYRIIGLRLEPKALTVTVQPVD